MNNPKKVLIIGSGPIVIGQAAEFDYSGTQALLACREEGIKTIVVNSNPATIQTDREIADVIYIEPLTVPFLEKIIAKEKPDGLIVTVGGQTGLNLATELDRHGILKKFHVRVLGTDIEAIRLSEDRGKFRNLMESIGQPVLPSQAVTSISEGLDAVKTLGFPVLLRSAYNLGGTGSGIAYNHKELVEKMEQGLRTSLSHQVLIEKSVIGWGEFEYEVIRDDAGNKIIVCNMENMDPMGVHTGESIVVAPSQTLSDDDHQTLRTAAFEIVNALQIKGSCNVQFAFNDKTGEYYVIEVNPRLSRSSALASKATGYPIAKVATKIALGKKLPEIVNDITGKTAFFEPSLDYLVVKIPRWPYDKFPTLDKTIGVTMKSTGEIMAIGQTFEETMLKAIQSLEFKENFFEILQTLSKREIIDLLKVPNMQRLPAVFSAFHKNMTDEKISNLTQINPWFIAKLRNLSEHRASIRSDIRVFKMVDTCAGEFEALTPYFYSTHGIENEAQPLRGPKVIILGSGPIRIGQGIEFDYLTVHAVKALKEKGIKAIIINNNPETVSTDYSISDRLYFEPLTPEFVSKVIDNEKDGLLGIIPQFGGQTAINLVESLGANVKILGTDIEAIKDAEDRKKTAHIIRGLGLNMPKWQTASTKEGVMQKANSLRYPVLIRPSFVLGGEGMIIAKNQDELKLHVSRLSKDVFKKPILIDKFLEGALEIDVDFISDGKKTLSFILEQLEPAGIHSGDSSCMFPPKTLTMRQQERIREITHTISRAFNIVGIANIQYAVKNDKIYVLEINPRTSRTVPFLNKCLGISLAKLATDAMLGTPIPNLSLNRNGFVAIKSPVFSFEKLDGVSRTLGPLMKSTGEKMSIGKTLEEAILKIDTTEQSSKELQVYRLGSMGAPSNLPV